MKHTIFISAVAPVFFVASQICGCGCKAQTIEKQPSAGESKSVTLKVTGMTCGGCANRIDKALSQKDGILEKEVKYPGDVAIVKYNPAKITEQEIISIIERTGYKAEVKKEGEKKKDDSKKRKGCSPGCG